MRRRFREGFLVHYARFTERRRGPDFAGLGLAEDLEKSIIAVADRRDMAEYNYKHGRYTAEMVATQHWLRETMRMLHELN